jgi:SAM-dependent methyltransferase
MTTPHDIRDRAYHDTISPEYDKVVNFPRRVANDILFSVVDPLVHPGAAMLDLGCGTGQMLLRYAPRFGRALGVDHSEGMLARARDQLAQANLGHVELRCEGLLDFLGRSGQRFDLVTCVGCLHHLRPEVIEALLAGVKSHLAPDGVFLFAEPVRVSAAPPAPVQEWNAASIAPGLAYSVHAVDPEEEPLDLAWLESAVMRAGLAIAAVSRGWELFPRDTPPSLADRLAIWRLHYAHGADGNVFCAVATHRDRVPATGTPAVGG